MPPDAIVSLDKKWILRLFMRNTMMLETLTYESPDELVEKFFPGKKDVVFVDGRIGAGVGAAIGRRGGVAVDHRRWPRRLSCGP